MSEPLQKTPLHAEHVALGARMVPFAGYEMPIQYPAGINAEHQVVRNAAGLFDVSHMGQVEVSGPDARDFVQFATSNDIDRATVGQAQYTLLLNDTGGIIDDLLVYRFPDRYLLVVNAANRVKDLAQLERLASGFDVQVADRTADRALLALQGPRAEAILRRLLGAAAPDPEYYRFEEIEIDGAPVMISRTGYTGEDGFELYLPARSATGLWRSILEVGGPEGLRPAGLGARDSLRLEMGYPLYGNELGEDRTPLEGGLGWVVKLDKGDFVGADALRRAKEAGIATRLAGFKLRERGFPRPGYEVRTAEGEAGVVTSGTVSPSLGVGLGFAYLPSHAAAAGTMIEVIIRDKPVPAEVVRPPFYRDGSVRS